ncbi:hypothetical protein ACFOHS_19290 [Jhaorihella thermophila]
MAPTVADRAVPHCGGIVMAAAMIVVGMWVTAQIEKAIRRVGSNLHDGGAQDQGRRNRGANRVPDRFRGRPPRCRGGRDRGDRLYPQGRFGRPAAADPAGRFPRRGAFFSPAVARHVLEIMRPGAQAEKNGPSTN